MNYPLLSEYIEAIRLAEDNFDQLSSLRPVLDTGGNPVMSSGNFAVVFKMRDEKTGKLHAVKCFLKEQEGRAVAYRMIAEELESVDSSYLTPIKYIDKELYVDTNSSDETEFPILLMDWVDGVTLDRYVRGNISNQYNLSLLAYRFSRLAMWLMPQPFAHGDLKPDNILVKADGTLVLVDYDGMYVPAMKGQQSRELGSPDFRHPNRTAADFDEHIDDFSLASILLSLKAISLQPGLLEKYGAKDRLLFSEKDYGNIADSKVIDGLKSLLNDKELSTLYSLFLISISLNNLSFVSFRLMEMNKPERPQAIIKEISTEATEEDLANAWTDEYGVMYSQDGQKVLKATKYLKGINYEIRKGVEIVCDRAFQMKGLHGIVLPETIVAIGAVAFANNKYLKNCNIPKSVRYIYDKNPWGGCFNIQKFVNDSPRYKIEDDMLISSDYEVTIGLIYWRQDLNLCIKTKRIAGNAFWSGIFRSNSNLKSVDLGKVTKIGEVAFLGCRGLTSITIPDSVTGIGDSAFKFCRGLISIIIPNGTKEKFEKLLDSSGQGEFKKLLTEEKSLNFEVKGVSFKMIHVDGGTFMMGATEEQGDDALKREKPAHKVTLSDYWMGETQVTQALWQAVMGSNPSRFKGSNRPVERVSWNDCQEFVNKLNSMLSGQLPSGRKFRLPTEAEWEYAARGGNNAVHQTMYAGSDDVDDVAWYIGNKTHDVKTKSPNALGIYDMSGNVWEWCQDWYGDYDVENQINPTGPSSGSLRVIRGGSWYYFAGYCRVSYRGNGIPSIGDHDIGLRVAL